MGKKVSLVNQGSVVFDQDSLLEYKELSIRYPYCQCARLMFLLNLRQLDDQAAYKTALPVTAINLPDRIRLKEQVDELQHSSNPRPTPNPGGYPSMQNETLPRRHVESFSPWSQALPKSKNVDVNQVRSLLHTPQTPPPPAPHKTSDAMDAINRFLSGNPQTITDNADFDYDSFNPDTGESNKEDFSMGSETLAQMYLQNRAPKKAIAIYENLRLKFPEKNSYFANLISKVKKEYHLK